ncbi:MAG: SCP2 sterol-binding domain-containing protein [Candidatus Hodarchaeota archaeon]
MPVFPSEAWLKVYVEKLNTNPEYKAAAKDWEGDFLFIVHPDESTQEILKEKVTWYFDLWHGECRSARVVEPNEELKTAYAYEGPYKNWKKLILKEIGPIKGLMQRKFKLTGNMMKVMRAVKAAQELVNTASFVDTQFIDE